jgi:hypothetical protein
MNVWLLSPNIFTNNNKSYLKAIGNHNNKKSDQKFYHVMSPKYMHFCHNLQMILYNFWCNSQQTSGDKSNISWILNELYVQYLPYSQRLSTTTATTTATTATINTIQFCRCEILYKNIDWIWKKHELIVSSWFLAKNSKSQNVDNNINSKMPFILFSSQLYNNLLKYNIQNIEYISLYTHLSKFMALIIQNQFFPNH